MRPVLKTILPVVLFLALAAAAFSQTTATAPPAPGVAATVMPLPEANPYACDADLSPALASREMPSGVETTAVAYAAVRLDAAGRVQEVLLLHDPIPSLRPQEIASLQRWDFTPPKKAGAPTAGWATLRLDLKIEFSRPQITKAVFAKVSPGEPLPDPLTERWDDSWLATAPPLADLHGAESVDALDVQPLPRRTRWLADRYRGAFPVRLWVEVSPGGKALRLVPVGLKDPVVLLYLQRAAARWNFAPARKGGSAVACWGILDLDGTIDYDVSLERAASVKKSAGPPAAPAPTP